MGRILSVSRYLVVLGVLTCLILAVALLVAALARAGVLVYTLMPALFASSTLKTLAVGSIEVADVLLIAVVLYVVATGLYELFVGDVNLPDWIVINNLEDLKDKLLSIVVAVLDVTFLVQVVNWDGTRNLLPFGLSIGAVVLSLAIFNYLQKLAGGKKQANQKGDNETRLEKPS